MFCDPIARHSTPQRMDEILPHTPDLPSSLPARVFRDAKRNIKICQGD
jgi:hypothetical protein